MKLTLKILGTTAITIGVFFVVIGVFKSLSDAGISDIAVVLGGGLFMALGIAIFQLNKNK
jgi:hypothetical protein